MNQDDITKSLATLTEQARWHSHDLHEIKVMLGEFNREIKNLNAFKFKVIGVAVLAVTLIEIARAKG